MEDNIHTVSYFKLLKIVQIILYSFLEAYVCVSMYRNTYIRVCAYIYTRAHTHRGTYIHTHPFSSYI